MESRRTTSSHHEHRSSSSSLAHALLGPFPPSESCTVAYLPSRAAPSTWIGTYPLPRPPVLLTVCLGERVSVAVKTRVDTVQIGADAGRILGALSVCVASRWCFSARRGVAPKLSVLRACLCAVFLHSHFLISFPWTSGRDSIPVPSIWLSLTRPARRHLHICTPPLAPARAGLGC
jgi:hypothetical protein